MLFIQGRPQEGFGRLQDVSPNVPLLALSFPSPGIKPSGSPGTNPRSTFSGVKTHSPQLGGPLGTFTASPGSWLADFGELADCSKLGELPGEEDLMLKLYEPEPLDNSIHIKVAAYPAAAAAPSQVPGPYLTSAGPQPSNPHLAYYEQPPPQQPYNHVGLTWVPHQGFDQGFSGVPVPLQLPHPAQPAMPMGTEHLNPYYTYPLPRNLSRNPSVDPMQLRAHLPSPGVTPPPERIKRQAEYFDPSPVARRRQRVSGGYSHGSNSSRKQQQIVDDPGANTGKTYRGVSRHRLTQRWEASLWLNGRQLYLGGFDAQIDAARAYDLAALACKGPDAVINFSPEEYDDQLREIEGFSREEVVAYVRRRSAAFSRGKSKYRGVSGHNGRWEARIGSFNGRKNVSVMKCFSTVACFLMFFYNVESMPNLILKYHFPKRCRYLSVCLTLKRVQQGSMTGP